MQKNIKYDLPEGQGKISASKLRKAKEDIQLDVMRNWFHSKFADPAEMTPYCSEEGGYIYIYGGPFEPYDQLNSEFGDIVPEKVIDILAKELHDIACEWTKHPENDELDNYFYEAIASTSKHIKLFEKSIERINELLEIPMNDSIKKHLMQLLYANIITSIETYLGDLFITSVKEDNLLLRKYIETAPEFKAQKIPFSDIFKINDKIQERAREQLLKVLWHSLDKIKPMYKSTLGINFPSDISYLCKAVKIRHDIVHRNGKSLEGDEHNITMDIINELVEKAIDFVRHIDTQWSDLFVEKLNRN